MAYREMPPPHDLRGLLSCTWERRVEPEEARAGAAVLPDGCVDILWNDGRLLVAGPDTGPAASRVRAGTTIVGARFHRGMAGAALGLPANELKDLRVDLADLWPREGAALAEQLGEAERPAECLGILARALAVRRSRMLSPDRAVVAAARMLGRPGSRVAALAGDLGIGERQMRRRFMAAVGYGPKTLDRVLRFQRLLDLAPRLRDGEESLGRAALDLGYSDQAHLSRECRALSGRSCRELLR